MGRLRERWEATQNKKLVLIDTSGIGYFWWKYF
jgi:hypothetical protein